MAAEHAHITGEAWQPSLRKPIVNRRKLLLGVGFAVALWRGLPGFSTGSSAL